MTVRPDHGPIAFAPSVSGEVHEPVCPNCGVTLTRFNTSTRSPYPVCKGCDSDNLSAVRAEDE